ncbi:hypothetical protein JW926_09550 [Candidatus Sumerlaeota bacterium]|nr:hypothetical protein [Candidatus Sumerlaeota bacterium]
MKSFNDMDAIANPLRRRLNIALWLNAALGRFIILMGILGAALLSLKMIRPELAPFSFYLFFFTPFLALYAWLECRKKDAFFKKYETIEILDCLFRDDGSVTAFYEEPSLNRDPLFYSVLKKSIHGRLPEIDPLYYVKRIIPVLLFFALAVLVPPRITETREQHRQIISSLTQPLVDKIEENSVLFSDEEKAELMQNLEEIQNDARGVSREKWEAIEEVQERIDKAVDLKNQNIQKMLSDLNRMSTLLDNQEQKIRSAPGSPKTQAAMEKLLGNLDLNNASMRLSPMKQAELDKLLNQMKEAVDKEALKQALGDLQKELSSCGCLGKEPGYNMCEGSGDGEGECPGRGGISRGRGDAAMVFGDDKTLPQAKFKDQELSNRFLTPEDLVDLGVTPLEPKPDPGKFSPGTLKSFESLEGTQVSRTRISPGQKDVISKYFAK